jgi:hypothetical protein
MVLFSAQSSALQHSSNGITIDSFQEQQLLDHAAHSVHGVHAFSSTAVAAMVTGNQPRNRAATQAENLVS